MHLKCGEVFLEDKIFIFECLFCKERYKDATIYMKHIVFAHSDNDNNSYIENGLKLFYLAPEKIIKSEKLVEIPFIDTNSEIKEEIDNIPGDDNNGNDDVSTSQSNYSKLFDRYECTECTEKFPMYSSASSHFHINHSDILYDKTRIKKLPQIPNQYRTIPQKIVSNTGKFLCNKCPNRKFPTYYYLKKHNFEIHSIESLMEAEETQLKVEQTQTAETHQNVTEHKCDVCDKIFQSVTRLKYHKYSHTDDQQQRQFKCHICPAILASPITLKKHIRRHLDNRKFSCNYCDMKFKLEKTKFSHEHLIHTKEKKFQCDKCGACFLKCHQLTKHVRSHLIEKITYSCSYCSAKFKFESAKISHEHLIHTREKPFACHICGDTFILRKHMTKHIKIHNPPTLECDVCDKKFTLRKYLQNHYRIHTGDKPYECQVCFKKFRRESHLGAHKKLHDTTKKYVCLICNKTFAQHAGLYIHKKSHKPVI